MLKREKSFKANRHQKFIECLSREDVDMGSSLFLLLPISSRLTLGLFFSYKLNCENWPGRGFRKSFVR